MIAHLLISLSVPATTTVAALIWARFVASGMTQAPGNDESECGRDIKTW